MSITSAPFGSLPDGQEVKKFTLSNDNGMKAEIIELGAIISNIFVVDRDGNFDDVVLGWNEFEPYLLNEPYFGATVGRYANRIGEGKFELDGQHYQLAINNGPNHLHGGPEGFQLKYWRGEIISDAGQEKLKLSYLSVDGEEDYSGNLQLAVIYSLSEDNELKIEYQADTDKASLCNLTNHSYFNLAGEGKGDILAHEVSIAASRVNKQNQFQVHQVETISVEGTELDFINARVVGEAIDGEHELLKIGAGYDQSWVLDKGLDEKIIAATLYEPKSGRYMEVITTQPAIQMYTANYLNDQVIGKGGKVYPRRSALCLEAQWCPMSEEEPYNIIRPEKPYRQEISFKFSTK